MTKNIVLIGMMGSGKTTVSKVLSERLMADAFSTDQWVEQGAHKKIKDIVAKDGWPHFRNLERVAVEQLSSKSGVIIDCGGGVVLDPHNLKSLKSNGIIFYLDASPSVLYERLKNDTSRPLLQVADPLAELENIYKQRYPHYNQAADFIIDATDPSVEALVAQILAKVE